MTSGIYTIIGGKIYVGRSVNVYKRLKEHERLLKSGKHHNSHLQSAYNLAPSKFLFEPLEFCEEEFLISQEQFWMNMTGAITREHGYNLDTLASNTGHKLSQETKDKIREKRLGTTRSPESIEKTRLANLGQKRPIQSTKMKKNWENVKDGMGFNNLSPEKQEQVRIKLAAATKERYKRIENLPISRVEVIVDGVTYPSLHKAAAALGIDRKTVKSRYLISK